MNVFGPFCPNKSYHIITLFKDGTIAKQSVHNYTVITSSQQDSGLLYDACSKPVRIQLKSATIDQLLSLLVFA